MEYEDFEVFQTASEKLQTALSAADSAAYFAATGDFSAQTTFKKGEAPTTPNLDASYAALLEARAAMAEVIRLVAPKT